MEIVAERLHGTRHEAGTDWPIVSVVTREQPRRWRLTLFICNGIAGGHRDFATRRAALHALDRC